MRESKTFAERTKILKSDEVKRKFFLVYEGASTESIYFDKLNEIKEIMGISPLIELVPTIRSYSEDGWSNPKKILDRVIANLEEEETGNITYESLLNRIMGYLYDVGILTTSRVQTHAIWKILQDACENILGKELQQDVVNLKSDCNLLVQYLNQESDIVNIVDDISDIIASSNITYEDGFDKICLIVDRDKESFVALPQNNQYEYVLRTCQEKGFGFYVSNPCFEFWLLLHFDEVFKLNQELLLENPKVTSKRRYAEHELRKLLPGYSKTEYNAERLVGELKTAMKNAQQFCEEVEALENKVGTNLRLLIVELLMDSKG